MLKQVKTSRESFIEHALASQNMDIQKVGAEVKAGQRGLRDGSFYSIVDASGLRTIKMFETQDDEETGIKNIAKARLEKGEIFLPDQIILLAATSTATTYDATAIAKLTFGSIGEIEGLSNGEFEMRSNKNKIIIPSFSNHVFVTEHALIKGCYSITNPQIIEDDVEIDFTIETKVAVPAKTAIKLILLGTVTVPS